MDIMENLKEFISTDEAKIGAGVFAGDYVSDLMATLIKDNVLQNKTQHKYTDLAVGILTKVAIGSLLFGFGKENLFTRYMAIGSWASILRDITNMFLPQPNELAKKVKAQFAGGQPINNEPVIITPQNQLQKKIPAYLI